MSTTSMRRIKPEGITRLIAVVIVAVQVLASPASAQTRVDIVPSATIGSIYDNNLFAKTNTPARDARHPLQDERCDDPGNRDAV